MNSKHDTFTYGPSREGRNARVRVSSEKKYNNNTHQRHNQKASKQPTPNEKKKKINNKTYVLLILYDDFVIVRTNVYILDENCEWLETVIRSLLLMVGKVLM